MRIIGLCGRSGSGKSFFRSLAEKEGFKVIDCDGVYANLVSHPSPCLLEIAENFGEKAIANNALNRAYLGPVVFNDKEKLNLLNTITHRHITAEVKDIISRYGDDDIVLLDAPLLFESNLSDICHIVVGIIATDEICIKRIVERDGISVREAEDRIKNQLSSAVLQEKCHIVIANETTAEDFIKHSLDVISDIKEGRV